jgi:dihydrofolate reductase
MLTGRRTYDIAKGWGGRHPVNGMPVITVTHERPKNVPKGESRLEFAASYADGIKLAKKLAGDKAVGIGGASVAQQALNAGDVDEILLHVAPIVVGDGVRLFANLERPVELEAIRVIHGPGVVHHHYRVVKPKT